MVKAPGATTPGAFTKSPKDAGVPTPEFFRCRAETLEGRDRAGVHPHIAPRTGGVTPDSRYPLGPGINSRTWTRLRLCRQRQGNGFRVPTPEGDEPPAEKASSWR